MEQLKMRHVFRSQRMAASAAVLFISDSFGRLVVKFGTYYFPWSKCELA